MIVPIMALLRGKVTSQRNAIYRYRRRSTAREEEAMVAKSLLAFVFALILGGPSFAAEFGTADEAKALLDRAIPEVQADRAAALAKFNSGEDGYRDRDLYVFCFAAADGVISAHPALVGTDVRTLKDNTGKAFGEEMFSSATEGTVSEIGYMFPRPGETEQVAKQSYYTRIGEDVCGVGYYQ
jgi:signal transduction histidine kinase